MPIASHRQTRSTLLVAPIELALRPEVKPWLRAFAASRKTAAARAMGGTIEMVVDAETRIAARLAADNVRRGPKSRGIRLARTAAELSAIDAEQSQARYDLERHFWGSGLATEDRVEGIKPRVTQISTPRPLDNHGVTTRSCSW
jgi:hypothetical protein